MARFLVLPGDVRFNFGDTAILHGTLALVRSVDPSAEVVVAARSPLLPGGMEGVRFAGTGVRTLCREARRADIVLWGGGQLLQGNRSRLKVPYQAARISIAATAGRAPIVGVAQGVGPLPRRIDRCLAARSVRRTAGFSVRDDASQALLESCGVPRERVRVTADPALLLAPAELSTEPPARGRRNGARPRVGLAARFTGHHRAGRLVPFQVLPADRRCRILRRAGFPAFVATWVELAGQLVERLDAELVLVPTYAAPWETDVPLAEAIAEGVGSRGRVTIVRPRSSVEEVTGACRELDALVAVPMHAAILAVGQRCPTLGLAYEEKGSSFLEQTGSPALPLAELTRPGAVERIVTTVERLVGDRDRVRAALDRRIKELRCRAAETAAGIRTALDDRRRSS
jgi:polysaccharide pyruvyl transferase WcaK-like protein